MKKVLLTGASGFVGSHVLRHILINTDWEVVCLSSFKHKGLTDRIRLAVSGIDESYERTKVLVHDLTAPISNVLKNEIGSIDYIINVASESHVDRSIEEPSLFIQNNIALMTNILDYARTCDIEAFLHVSTDEVYGPAESGKFHREWQDIYLPSNPYSASKAAQESIAYSYWRTYGIPLIITNTMNIIGETQDPEKFVPMTIKKIINDQVVPVHASKDGSIIGSRFYLHARNQADGILFSLTQPILFWPESSVPQKFHIVGEKEIDNLQMAKIISETIGKDLKYEFVDFHSSRPGHDLRYALDGSKIKNAGWSAPISFEDSLTRTVLWTINHKEWLSI